MSYTRAKKIGIALGMGMLVAVGGLATMGQYTPGPPKMQAVSTGGLEITGNSIGLTTDCSPGERLEWDGSGWECSATGEFTTLTSSSTTQLGNSADDSVRVRANDYVSFTPPLQSGDYYFVPSVAGLGAATPSADNLRCVSEYIPNAVTLDRIGAEITIVGDAGSTYRLCIYGDDGVGEPGALVVDAGAIAGDSATVQELTISTALNPGVYHFCGVAQNVTATQPTIRALATASSGMRVPKSAGTVIPTAGLAIAGYSQGSVSGECPANFTANPSISGLSPRIFVRVQ